MNPDVLVVASLWAVGRNEEDDRMPCRPTTSWMRVNILGNVLVEEEPDSLAVLVLGKPLHVHEGPVPLPSNP